MSKDRSRLMFEVCLLALGVALGALLLQPVALHAEDGDALTVELVDGYDLLVYHQRGDEELCSSYPAESISSARYYERGHVLVVEYHVQVPRGTLPQTDTFFEPSGWDLHLR